MPRPVHKFIIFTFANICCVVDNIMPDKRSLQLQETLLAWQPSFVNLSRGFSSTNSAVVVLDDDDDDDDDVT